MSEWWEQKVATIQIVILVFEENGTQLLMLSAIYHKTGFLKATILKFLKTLLLRGTSKIDIDDKLILEYYKNEKSVSGSIGLDDNKGGVAAIQGGIIGKEKRKDLPMVNIYRAFIVHLLLVMIFSCFNNV